MQIKGAEKSASIGFLIFRLIGGTSSIFGLLGAKHLDASVVSPLENIDGAVTAIILYMFFEFTGRSHVTDSIGIVERIGTATCLITLRADIKRIPCPNSKNCSNVLLLQLLMLIQMPILLSG